MWRYELTRLADIISLISFSFLKIKVSITAILKCCLILFLKQCRFGSNVNIIQKRTPSWETSIVSTFRVMLFVCLVYVCPDLFFLHMHQTRIIRILLQPVSKSVHIAQYFILSPVLGYFVSQCLG